MRQFIRRTLIFFVLLFSALSISLYIPFFQTIYKVTIEHVLARMTGSTVTLGTIRGIAPFYITCDDIEITAAKTSSSIKRVVLIPSWPDLLLGRLGFLYCSATDIQYTESNEPVTAPLFESLPNYRISLYSYTCILNSKTYKGQFFWRPKKQSLQCKILSPDTFQTFYNIEIDAHISKKEIKSRVKANVLPNSLFHTICLDANFTSHHPDLFKRFVEPLVIEKEASFATGTCSVLLESKKFERTNIAASFEYAHDSVLLFKVNSVENGFFNLSGQLQGALSLSKENRRLAIEVPTLSISSQNFTNLTLAAEWRDKQKIMSGECALNGERNKTPLHFSSRFETDGINIFTLKEADLQLNNSALKGTLGASLNPLLLHGKLNGTSSSLQLLSALLKKNIQGKSRYEIILDPNYDTCTQSIEASCELSDVASTRSNFEKIACQVAAFGPLDALSCNYLAKVDNGQFKHLEIDSATLSGSFKFQDTLQKFPFQLSSKGKSDKGPFSIQLSGKASTEELAIDFFELGSNSTIAKLKAPFQLTRETLTPLQINWNTGAELLLQAHIGKNRTESEEPENNISGYFRAHNVPLDFLHLLQPTFFASGTLSGEGTLFGSHMNPRLHLAIGSDAMLLQNKTYDRELPIEVSCQIDVADLEASIKAEFDTPGELHPLRLTLKLPLEVEAFPYSISFNHFQSLYGSLQGQINLSKWLGPSLSEDESIEGELTFDTELSGDFYNPHLAGTIQLQKGALHFSEAGLHFSDMTMQAALHNRDLVIEMLHAKDKKSGTLSLHGKALLSQEQNYPFRATLETQNYELFKKDFLSITASSKMRLEGNSQGTSIVGDALLNSADLNIGSNFASGLAPLEFQYINGEDDTLLESPIEAPYPIKLDINAALPKEKGHIFGRGIDSYWSGEARLTGEINDILVNGSLNTTKGVFQFAGKEFQLVTSSIDFTGNLLTGTRFNVAATKDLNSIRATIFLRGTLAQPRFLFQSAPELPQKEVLSYILFSKPLSDVSAMEGVMLANAALTLKGSRTPFSFFDGLKSSLGIDQINISKNSPSANSTTPDASYSLQVGKYLSDNLLLRLSKDVATAANRVAVQAHVSKNLSVQAEVGDDQEGQMSLMWKHDY